MKITSLTVKNYRNLAPQTLILGSGLNVFFGGNAQGKTNLLESVYLCCLGKSPKTERDKDLVKWGQTVAHVKCSYNCRFGDGQISVGIDCTGAAKKHVSVNSVPIKKLGDLLGYLNCVYFSPDEIAVVSQSPAERRKFLDIDLCQTDKSYFYSLGRFNKALLQRNNLLKNVSSLDQLRRSVFVWDKQIAENGAKVIFKRKQFCLLLKELADKCHKHITFNKENLSVQYLPSVDGETLLQLTENYLAALEANLEKDFQLRYTAAGCQRDDIALLINGKDVRQFGSQGQQRTAALALKLAELEIFKQLTGEIPVLLLDDVLSELDAERQKQLLNFSGAQILLTTACEIDSALLPPVYTSFAIENGAAAPDVKSK